MQHRLITSFAALLAVFAMLASPAKADSHDCEWDPATGRYVCGGGNDGGGSDPGDPGDPPAYSKAWGSWGTPGTECTINGGPNDGLVSLRGFRWLYWIEGPLDGRAVNAADVLGHSSGDVVPNAPLRWDGTPPVFNADGYVYDAGYCVDPAVAWDVYAEIAKRAPAVGFARDPQVRGLVGLEQWVWYTGGTTIPEFYLTWTDPLTGLDFELEARARIEAFRWDFGDGTSTVAYTPGSGPDDPSATHIYQRKGDVTLQIEVQWLGEYRVYQAGAVPGPWNVVPNGPTFTASDSLTVIEVRSCLGAACP